MAPNLDDNLLNIPSKDLILFMDPLSPEGLLLSDDTSDLEIGLEDDDIVPTPPQLLIPFEYNFRAFLVQITGTESLDTITQLKLRVIAREVPLQQLSIYIPALRELVLDGSVISTLRDLGYGLKNLKSLSVNRCGIKFFDNMFSFENLEELYAADNLIENTLPLAFLTNLKSVDLRRNHLKSLKLSLSFLALCEQLQHIYLEGNEELLSCIKYRQTVKSLLPTLKTLDGITYAEVSDEATDPISSKVEVQDDGKSDEQKSKIDLASIITKTTRPRLNVTNNQNGFVITFPPKVCLDKTL